MHLSRFPRVRLCHAPTPLEPMANLSKILGGPNLFVKRDDCTGLATGGNKTRKLDFLMGEAIDWGADCVVTQGAVQSNHCRQTAAAATRLGLGCYVLLERRVPNVAASYEVTGNVFLDQLFGAEIRFCEPGKDMNAAAEALGEELAAKGKKPYVIPGGGSNPTGALGYVSCALEMLIQANDRGLHIDYVVHATGSAGTQAGLVVGLKGSNSGIRVQGISVRNPKDKQEQVVHDLAQRTAAHVGIKGGISREAIRADDGYVGPGYGQPTAEMVEAVKLTARSEGILLDPVYSGKGMAGLIGLVRGGRFEPNQNVVFVHTGGSAALFAYQDLFSKS
ncbi:MAG: D-cysteine desulfhydrase [Gammaproteobacteria bacterium]|nr:D-cysteine desulfhydrase [Gammaproteobacteria bacterium]